MRWQLLRALPALLLWAGGCEALVNGQLGDVRCAAEGTLGPPACPSGYACTGGHCVPSGMGAPCAIDADCAAPDFCLDARVFGGPAAAGGPGRCSRPCCSSGECDTSFVCAIAHGGGSSFCRPAAEIARATGGTRQPMQPCGADGDCRSGRCLDQVCLDTCCSDTVCAVGAAGPADAGDRGDGGHEGGAVDAGEPPPPPPIAGACRFVQPAGGEPFGAWCTAPGVGAATYGSCESDGACASGLCTAFVGALMGTGKMCASPCCTTADCVQAMGPAARCVTLPGPNAVRACAALAASTATGNLGDPCATQEECRSGLCLGQMCSDSCCSDDRCGGAPSLGCRPTLSAGAWALQCVLK